MNVFYSDKDTDLGKIVKRQKLNSTGENIYLHPDGKLTFDEDKIIAIQRIVKHNLYKPGGQGAKQAITRLKNIATSSK